MTGIRLRAAALVPRSGARRSSACVAAIILPVTRMQTKPAVVTIRLLAEHPDALPWLQRLFEREWPSYYGPGGRGDAARDLRSFASRSTLPVGIVAVLDERVCGIAALKKESIPSHGHLAPWAAAGLVEPLHRGQGIGSRLVQGLEDLARSLGYPAIHCATSTSETLLRRRAWQLCERVVHDGENLGIYRKVLE